MKPRKDESRDEFARRFFATLGMLHARAKPAKSEPVQGSYSREMPILVAHYKPGHVVCAYKARRHRQRAFNEVYAALKVAGAPPYTPPNMPPTSMQWFFLEPDLDTQKLNDSLGMSNLIGQGLGIVAVKWKAS